MHPTKPIRSLELAAAAPSCAYSLHELFTSPELALRRAEAQGSRERLVVVAQELVAALAFLHAGGIVHGDLRPKNVLFSDGCDALRQHGVSTPRGLTHFSLPYCPRRHVEAERLWALTACRGVGDHYPHSPPPPLSLGLRR